MIIANMMNKLRLQFCELEDSNTIHNLPFPGAGKPVHSSWELVVEKFRDAEVPLEQFSSSDRAFHLP